MNHGSECPRAGKWFKLRECQKFSTDGTGMGAIIAHLYGTDSEEEICAIQDAEYRAEVRASLTGMDEEQADWEADE